MNNNSTGGTEDLSVENGTTNDASENEVTREVDIEAIATEKGKEVIREVGIEQISTDNEIPRSSEKEAIQEVENALIRLEVDIACCSEKLLNMNLLMMHLAAKEIDIEVFASDKEDSLFDSDGEIFEFDILSGIFDSEVKEMGVSIGTLENDVSNTRELISSYKHLGDVFLNLEGKLLDAGELINQLKNQVSEFLMQSTKFQMILSSFNQEETSDEDREAIDSSIGDICSTTTKLKMQTSEQQRHALRMLKKSLARELELKEELKECITSLHNMKNELGSSQQELAFAKEETQAIYCNFLEADSASIVLMGVSKELIGKLQLCQFKLNSALHHENEMSRKLQDCTEALHNSEKKEAAMRELAEKNSLEASALKERVKSLENQLKTSEFSFEKVDSLEKQVRETDVQLQEAMASIEASQEKQTNMKNELGSSQQELVSAKEETQAIYSNFLEADSASTVLMGVSKELIGKLQLCQFKLNSALHHENEMNRKLQECTEALHTLEKKEAAMREVAEKNSLEASALKEKVKSLENQLKTSEFSFQKVDSLEKQVRETDVQLQEAIASIEASQEKQTMLYSSISDMEILIEKLKSQVFEANTRADSAEDKLIILSESHAELNEEVNFLRGKLECLEASLQKAEETKRATAKDLDIRTKLITNMVMQLAGERERLQKQLSMLTIENKDLVDKLHMTNKMSSNHANHKVGEIEKGNKEDFDATEAEKSAVDVIGIEGNLDAQEIESKLETVRTIDAGRLNTKYVFSAILIVFVAVVVLYFILPENCPYPI